MKHSIFILVLFICFSVTSQNSDRQFASVKEHANHIEIVTNNGSYQIKPLNNQVIQTSFIPQGETYIDSSHAVKKGLPLGKYQLTRKTHTIEINTDGIRLEIQKKPLQLTYYYKDKLLISEGKGYEKTDSTEILDFKISETEALMGAGARVLGMNRRGHRLELYNRAHYGYETHSTLMNYTMPLVLSSNLYAVHFDNAAIGFLDLDSHKTNTLQYETISGRKTYQVIAGNDWYQLTNAYTTLTGKQPLPPRWALGNFASRFGYHSQKEVEHTVQLFKEHQIPLDAVIIDIYWFGKDIKGHMGNLEFYKDSFPQPQKMIQHFKDENIKTILVTEPFILTTSKKWNEASSQNFLGFKADGKPYNYDFYFGNTGIVDLFNPKANQWFWNIYKDFTKQGIAGWWGDLGEPEVHPSDLFHYNGLKADEVHNIYGHFWAKMVFEGYQKDFPKQRPFILMRAGYTGSQKYGMIPWSGDVNRTWGGLKAQPEIALQMGIQGLGYMHSDLGGFAGGDVFDSELYTRWLQYGVFQPVFRPHAQEHIAAEPVYHDTKTMALAKKAIELRYQLLPYNYTLAFNNQTNGTPLMRPLFFEDPLNMDYYNSSKSYLWGDYFLVTPILEKGQKQVKIDLPKTSKWFDFYSNQLYQDDSILLNTQESQIPVMVKAGAFVPMIKTIQHTEQYQFNQLDLHYYHHRSVKQSNHYVYYDDGITPNSKQTGAYEILHYSSKLKNGILSINLKPEIGKNWMAKNKTISLVIHGIESAPKKIKSFSYQYHKETKSLTIEVEIKENNKEINIKL